MNSAVLSGRLTADPVTRKLANDKGSVTSGTVAINEGKDKAGKPVVQFVQFEIWNRYGEKFAELAHKGTPVGVSGALKSGSYTDRNGVKRNTLVLRVDKFDINAPKAAPAASAPQAEEIEEVIS